MYFIVFEISSDREVHFTIIVIDWDIWKEDKIRGLYNNSRFHELKLGKL